MRHFALELFAASAVLLTGSCAGDDSSDTDSFSATEQPVPPELQHSDADSPVPTWEQLTRDGDPTRTAHVVRIVGGGDASLARAAFAGWTASVRRGFALLIDKIDNEGWLDSVDRLEGDPWESAFHFRARTAAGSFEQIMVTKAEHDGVYTENTLYNGASAYLTKWNHQNWTRGWIENDIPHAALHVGIAGDGAIEVHMELYDPIYTNGAPLSELYWAPGFGWINWRLTGMHLYWETGARAQYRTSANYYHFLNDAGFPLSF